MWSRQKALATLHEHLRTLDVFDRVHDYAPKPDPVDDCAYAVRQTRRSEILAETEKLRATKTEDGIRFWISITVFFLGAVAYSAVHYLIQ